METRVTLRPGQNGTKRLLERYGDRLVCVRYHYDPMSGRRVKTVELIVDGGTWQPTARPKPVEKAATRQPAALVNVRVMFHETQRRERIKAAGGRRDMDGRLWRVSRKEALDLGIEDRIQNTGSGKGLWFWKQMGKGRNIFEMFAALETVFS